MSIFTGAGVAIVTPMKAGRTSELSDREWNRCDHHLWNYW